MSTYSSLFTMCSCRIFVLVVTKSGSQRVDDCCRVVGINTSFHSFVSVGIDGGILWRELVSLCKHLSNWAHNGRHRCVRGACEFFWFVMFHDPHFPRSYKVSSATAWAGRNIKSVPQAKCDDPKQNYHKRGIVCNRVSTECAVRSDRLFGHFQGSNDMAILKMNCSRLFSKLVGAKVKYVPFVPDWCPVVL